MLISKNYVLSKKPLNVPWKMHIGTCISRGHINIGPALNATHAGDVHYAYILSLLHEDLRII